MLGTEERNPAHLAIILKKAVEEFDEKHQDDPAVSPATPLLESFLPFLWGAANERIDALPRIADLDDRELQQWGERMHSQFLLLPPQPQSTPQTDPADSSLVLATNIQNQTSMMERLIDKRDAEKEGKKSKFENLSDSSKNLMLNASSPDGEYVPLTPQASCTNFFSKKDGAKARDLLEETLELKIGCVVSVDKGAALALYAGVFVRDIDDLPSNFSFFLVPKKKPSSVRSRNKSMLLQLKVLNGQGWSEKDFKEVSKQGIEAPNSIEELRFQLENFSGLSAFFFGETFLLTRNLTDFVKKIKTRVVAFDAHQENDFEFATKIGYAVDTRVFRWIQQCRDAEDRESVDDSLVNFNPILNDVLLDRFAQPLPNSLACFSNKKRKQDPDGAGPGRKKYKDQDDESNKVVNDEQVEQWNLRNNEDYSCFAGKFQ